MAPATATPAITTERQLLGQAPRSRRSVSRTAITWAISTDSMEFLVIVSTEATLMTRTAAQPYREEAERRTAERSAQGAAKVRSAPKWLGLTKEPRTSAGS